MTSQVVRLAFELLLPLLATVLQGVSWSLPASASVCREWTPVHDSQGKPGGPAGESPLFLRLYRLSIAAAAEGKQMAVNP